MTSNTTGILNIIADGYLWATSTNTGFSSVTVGSTTQVLITMGNYPLQTTPVTVSTTTRGLSATLKISSFNNELGGSIMPTSGSPFTASTTSGYLTIMSQHYNSTDGAWYVAATSTNEFATGTLTASISGYVSESTTTVITSTSTQQTFNVGTASPLTYTYNIAGLPFGVKVAVNDDGGYSISGATVTAGSAGVSCSEGSVAVYYCAVALPDAGTSAIASKTGWTSGTGTYTDRTANSNAQSTVTVTIGEIALSTTNGGTSISTGGSSSGGGGYYYQAPTVTPVATVISGCPAGYVCTINSSVSAPAQNPASSVSLSAAASAISRRLNKGASGNDVKALQVMLNSSADTQISMTGAGSPGNETNYFGGLTQTAVQKFQVKYKVANPGDAGYGQVGPMTKAMLLKVFGK